MTSMRDKLSSAVNSAEADSSLFHNIVHGNDTTVVSTEGGQVPSVAKAIKDICATITNESNNIVEIAQTAAQTASEKAIICKESEKIVLENVKGSQNAKIWAEGTDEEVAECGGTHSARGWVELARKTPPKSPEEINMWEVAPAYILSELKTAFEIGFIVFVPFIVLDLIVANILLALGMFMLSPTIISLPFKLLIFIAVDGWALIVQGLVQSYN